MENNPNNKASIDRYDVSGIEALTGMSESQIQLYLENGSGVAPDEEAQGSAFTIITLVAMC